jgi:hypothetical protein
MTTDQLDTDIAEWSTVVKAELEKHLRELCPNKAYGFAIELPSDFTDAIDPDSAAEIKNYVNQGWGLKRTAKYGSDHFNQRAWQVTSASLLADGKTVRLTLPDIAPTWGIEIVYQLKTASPKTISGKIHNTIHQLKDLSP